ncbi:hypothetical protein EI94DRAFT_1705995 [Lactarius quietus]|nr:hypothetical protein EI94DRAFT_1705995 [Lactarius quietus]
MSSSELIPSPARQGPPVAHTPAQKPKGGSKPQRATPGGVELLVEFAPPYHSHLAKCAVALVPHPVHVVKKMLNGVGNTAFFNLLKGGCKANNAQREKQRLARKWRHAAKREREHEAAKAAKLPPQERSCSKCGSRFTSCKTARKHKCPISKGKSVREEAIEGSAVQVAPPIMPDKPAASMTPCAPPTPSNSAPLPMVTGASWRTQIPSHQREFNYFTLMPPTGQPAWIGPKGVELRLREGWRFCTLAVTCELHVSLT